MKSAFQDISKQLLNIKKKGSFVQNVSIVFTGNVVNLLMQIGFAPIISRLYGPEAYGEYAYYNIIVSNISFIAAMSFPSVYVLPKTRSEFLALAKVVIYAILSLFLLSLIVFLVLNEHWKIYEGELIAIPLLGFIVLLSNFNGITDAWNMRSKNFTKNSYVGSLGNLIGKSSTLSVGYLLKPTGLGLLSGDAAKAVFTFFSQTSVKVRLVIFRYLISMRNWREVFDSVKKNIGVPKYIFPSQLLNKWTSDIPLLLIGGYYSKEYLGFYSFAMTMLNLPRNLMANAIQPVFFQKANELFLMDQAKCKQFVANMYSKSMAVMLLPSYALIFLSPWLFEFFFGEEWFFAGKIAVLISFQYALSTVLTAIGGVRRIIGLEKKIFLLSLLAIIFKMLPLLLIFTDSTFLEFIFYYSLSNTIYLLINISDLIFNILPRPKSYRLVVMTILYVVPMTLIVYLFYVTT